MSKDNGYYFEMLTKPLVIFDIDGTLANTVEVDDLCYSATFRDLFDVDLGQIDWTHFPHVTDLGVCKSIFEDSINFELTEELLTETKLHFVKLVKAAAIENPEYFSEVSGANSFFEELKSLDFPVAIATGGWGESAKFKLDQTGLDYRDVPFTNSNDHFSREEIIKLAIKRGKNFYKVEFPKVIYIGDGEWDYSTCENLGIEFIGIDSEGTGELKRVGVATVFRDFQDPKEIIQAINNF